MITDADLKAARESRRYLASQHCECSRDCAAEECVGCGNFEPRCLMDMSEAPECSPCLEKRMAYWERESRTHVPDAERG